MLFSAKAEYACLAMLELAVRYGDPRPVRLADIADKHGIPQRFLVQILLQLKGAGLVVSTRGASGGYRLARPAAAISLREVLAAIDGPDEPAARGAHEPAAQVLADVWDRLREAQRAVLEQTSIAQLAEHLAPREWVI
jgi:Rrf2 family transcriptional regulator, cysteine metabolism repressor